MARTEIKIGGFGGQGVILSGIIIGKAAALFDNKHGTLIHSFGPEARGSACSAQVIVSDDAITYPYVRRPAILVVMSQEAYTKFEPELQEGGILITEEDLIHVDALREGIHHFSIPATRIAEELGRKIVLNIVMIGFFTAVTRLLSLDAMRQAVADSIPKGTEDLNLRAFQHGYEYGMELLSQTRNLEGDIYAQVSQAI
jgi:2-oxoglutarate ferredoxin oxidoreductase subunit gamma